MSAHSFPEFLFRAGLFADWFELRVGWNCGSVDQQVGGVASRTSGAEDLYLGCKLGLTEQKGWLPEMALVPQMTLPPGHPAFTSGRVLPGVNWLYGWDISEFVSAGGSTQLNMAIDPATTDEYFEFAQAWTIGYTLTEKLGAYTEWFMITPAGAESILTEHYLDGGFTYKLSKDLQFDIRAGKGISDAAADYFAGAGAVVRW